MISYQLYNLFIESEEPQPGQEWPCGACAVLLGTCHLTAGITLIIFDVITNHVSGTAFAISASLSFIICAILAFIGARYVCLMEF